LLYKISAYSTWGYPADCQLMGWREVGSASTFPAPISCQDPHSEELGNDQDAGCFSRRQTSPSLHCADTIADVPFRRQITICRYTHSD